MPVVTIGLDLAKAVFQAHRVDDAGQTRSSPMPWMM